MHQSAVKRRITVHDYPLAIASVAEPHTTHHAALRSEQKVHAPRFFEYILKFRASGAGAAARFAPVF